MAIADTLTGALLGQVSQLDPGAINLEALYATADYANKVKDFASGH